MGSWRSARYAMTSRRRARGSASNLGTVVRSGASTAAERMRQMTWRVHRRGLFEGPPHVLYGRTRARYFEVCALVIVLNGVIVSGFGVVVLALYVDLSVSEAALFAACLAVGFGLEGAVAALYFVRSAGPSRAWLAGVPTDDAELEA